MDIIKHCLIDDMDPFAALPLRAVSREVREYIDAKWPDIVATKARVNDEYIWIDGIPFHIIDIVKILKYCAPRRYMCIIKWIIGQTEPTEYVVMMINVYNYIFGLGLPGSSEIKKRIALDALKIAVRHEIHDKIVEFVADVDQRMIHFITSRNIPLSSLKTIDAATDYNLSYFDLSDYISYDSEKRAAVTNYFLSCPNALNREVINIAHELCRYGDFESLKKLPVDRLKYQPDVNGYLKRRIEKIATVEIARYLFEYECDVDWHSVYENAISNINRDVIDYSKQFVTERCQCGVYSTRSLNYALDLISQGHNIEIYNHINKTSDDAFIVNEINNGEYLSCIFNSENPMEILKKITIYIDSDELLYRALEHGNIEVAAACMHRARETNSRYISFNNVDTIRMLPKRVDELESALQDDEEPPIVPGMLSQRNFDYLASYTASPSVIAWYYKENPSYSLRQRDNLNPYSSSVYNEDYMRRWYNKNKNRLNLGRPRD